MVSDKAEAEDMKAALEVLILVLMEYGLWHEGKISSWRYRLS